MILLENVDIHGWEAAIRGMRNPMNSWDRSDSKACFIGKNDLELMTKLAKAGSEHAKYRRMITVTVDIIAPLYWWKEFDTYKIGTIANSCSTMHSIHKKEFTLDDFSHEHLHDEINICKVGKHIAYIDNPTTNPVNLMSTIIGVLNCYREKYLQTKDKSFWWQMIQLLPSSYNQKRTVMLNYEVLANIYRQRKEHKLDEWRDFCRWIEKLPYSKIITG